jgi:mono/diheme cytochrome c family protein
MTSHRRTLPPLFGLLLIATTMMSGVANPGPRTVAGEALPASRSRRPSALAITGDGATLLVANGRSGTVSEIDVKGETLVAEHEIGRGLADLVLLPDGVHLAAIDSADGQILLLRHRAGRLSVIARLAIGPDPIRVAVLPGGKACAVASRWPRRLAIVDVELGEAGAGLTLRRTVDLPFQPREVLPLREGKALLVADAFGGKLAIVDPVEGVIRSVRELPAHNLRGLAATPDGLGVMMAQQASSRLATSSFDDVHWGALMKNQVVTLRIDALLDPAANLLRGSSTRDLDEVGHAAGDPEALAIDPRGRPVVALAGVGEVAILGALGTSDRRIPAGIRPSSVALGLDGRVALVADPEGDAVAILPLDGGPARLLSLGPRPEPTAIERGERLFSSAKLSHHGWMSCRSCHADGHTGGFLADTLGDGSYGAPKLVPSLLGVGSTGPWGWLGNFPTLEDQVRSSVETTLRAPSPSIDQVADLTAYLRSLEPPPPSSPPAGAEAVARGGELYRAKKCGSCHSGGDLGGQAVRDVGLADEVGRRAFNPPSLRGVGHRARFLHDGRARSLDAVFAEHRHPPGAPLSAAEVSDLVAYLLSNSAQGIRIP